MIQILGAQTMREYSIKRGHHADINKLISTYFGATGDIGKGIKFQTEGIGEVSIKQEKNSLFIDIIPPKTICSDYSIIKKWNQFLLEATGRNTKERKKEFGKI